MERRIWLSPFAGARKSLLSKKSAQRLQIEHLEDRVNPSTLNFLVNTLSPTSATATPTSGGLADAVAAANADTTDSTVSITFDPSVFTGVSRVIALTSGLTLNPTNTKLAVIIDATTVGGVTINGGGTVTDLSTLAGSTSLTDLTITNGFASNGVIGNGGGIYNTATLNITDSSVRGNSAEGASAGGGGGGGIYNSGTLTIVGSTISGNTAFGSGNGAEGGGILNTGTLNLTSSTVANNASANSGGGIESTSSLATLVNDTIAGNGILSFGSGAGLDNDSGKAISLTNTIVADNAANGDLSDTGADSNYTGSFDIIGDASSLSNLTNSQNGQYPANLPLAPLNYYGGPTETIALLGTPFVGTSEGAPTTDQRGLDNDGTVDIGAYQSQTPAVNSLVTTANDPGVPGLMSLRGAIDLADLQTSSTAITFAAVYDIQITVPTTLYLNDSNTGAIITIDATSVGGATVDGGGTASNFSVFEVDDGTVQMTDLTISNGNNSFGGGIYNDATLSMTNCTFMNNSASDGGGGLYNDSTLTLTGCTFTTNSSGDEGGGLYNDSTLTLTGCTFTSNSSSGSGGGLYNNATLTVSESSFTNNSGGSEGGGLDNEDILTVLTSTFENNTANYGGGLYNDATLTMNDSTIADNSLIGTGGGAGFGNEGTATVTDSNITDNTAGNAGDVGGGILNYYLLTLKGDTVSGNSANTSGGGIADEGTLLTITNCTISANTSPNGGGLYSTAITTITASLITGNISTSVGGAVYAASNGKVSVDRTTISDNSAAINGGGFFNIGTLAVTNSTLSENSAAANGGAIAQLSGTITIINSTLSGNSALSVSGQGGGIAALSSGITVLDSTLNGNSAATGGGIYLGSPVLLVDTIIANSLSGGDLAAGTVSSGSTNNLIDDAATGSGLTDGVNGNIIGHPALLGTLADNGGPTLTISLLAGSPALNAGTPLSLTTLGDPAASGDATLSVESSAELSVGLYLLIDSEVVLVTAIDSTTSVDVLRGQMGTTPAAHDADAALVLATDQRGVLRSATTPGIGAFETITPLTPTITAEPPPFSDSPSAAFSFSSTISDFNHFLTSLDGSAFTTASSTQTFTGLAEGSHTFEVEVVDNDGNISDPASYTWTVDLTLPTATITITPPLITNVTTDSFNFTGTDPVSNGVSSGVNHLEDEIDDSGFVTAAGMTMYSNLAEGSHTFQVRAVDNAGNVGTAATYTFTIDITAPIAAITANPPAFTNSTAATFSFSGTDPVSNGVSSGLSELETELDGAEFTEASSPETFTDLAQGSHTFEVEAIDNAGNISLPVSYAFTVDTIAPVVSITANPPSYSNSTAATFSFTATDSGSGIAQVKSALDGGAFGSATSPQTFTGLAAGSHTFQVEAVDNAGNISISAAYTWTVDVTAPTIAISAPSVTTTIHSPVTYTVTYGDANFQSVTLSPDNITLNATGSATGTLGVSIDGNVATVTISNITGTGTLSLSIAAGTASDKAGNLAPAAGPSTIVNVGIQKLIAVGSGPGVSPEVKVYNAVTGALEFDFLAYAAAFTGGVTVATGDVNGDGIPDIITGAGPGGGPNVRVFNGTNGGLLESFFAYDPKFTGGVFVAAADVNRDGFADIITGAGVGGGPQVKVFSGANNAVLFNFFAYSTSFRDGVTVAGGDVNGDGTPDIVTGAGHGGGPNVRVFSGVNGTMIQSFFAYDPKFTGGVSVAVADVNGDGFADIITGAGLGGGPEVKVFSGATDATLSDFFAYDTSFRGGVSVAAVDVAGSGLAEIITGAGPGGSSHVKIFDGATPSDTMQGFFAFDFTLRNGVFVG